MKILIVAKQSKYEWEKQKFNLSHDELVKKYSKERANLPAILESHEKQLHVREQFKNVMPDSTMCFMDQTSYYLNKDEFDLVIVLGGDNSFTYVSHWLTDTPVLGVNSDPERSVGCLTRWSINDDSDIFDMVEMLDFNEYDIQDWTRLAATIDGKLITSASNEYFFGERIANKMSRHVLVHNGKEYEQKCSGILITTGSGSSGWYNSISGSMAAFDPTFQLGAFIVREPYAPVKDGCYHGEISLGDELTLYSLNDDEGHVSVDSWEEFAFTRGSEARICLGNPLRVVIPRGKQDEK